MKLIAFTLLAIVAATAQDTTTEETVNYEPETYTETEPEIVEYTVSVNTTAVNDFRTDYRQFRKLYKDTL